MAIAIHERPAERLKAEEIARWKDVPTAIIADVSKGTVVIDPALRPLRPAGQQPRLFGRAVTAVCQPPDFGAVLAALDQVRAGDVFVIDAQGFAENAMIGGILGGFLHRKRAAGIVCDGAVRDVAELAAMQGLSVFSRSVTPMGPTGYAQGEVNGAARIGGLKVAPGDLVIGDDDGLVALDPDMIRGLIDAAEKKLALEAQWIANLEGGRSVKETFGL